MDSKARWESPPTEIRWVNWRIASFRLAKPEGYRFEPGQFSRLKAGEVWRPMSPTNAPEEKDLEFLAALVPGGAFSEELRSSLEDGKPLGVDPKAYGEFGPDLLPDGPDLWLLAAGTGLAPFLPMLSAEATWERFESVVLALCVRERGDFAFLDRIEAEAEKRGGRLTLAKMTTRDDCPGALRKRIPAALLDGSLEAAAGKALSKERSRILACGGLKMCSDTRQALKALGYESARSDGSGQFRVEAY